MCAADKKRSAAPAHPPVAEMVTTAITTLKDRKGTSLPAIKKFVADKYAVDVDRLGIYIRKFLKKSVEEGKMTQVKASYKLTKPVKEDKPKKAPGKPKEKSPKRSAKPKETEKAKTTPKKKTAKKTEKTKAKTSKDAKPKSKASKSPKRKTAKKKPAPKKAKKPAAKK